MSPSNARDVRPNTTGTLRRTAKSAYFPHIDALRAIAVLGVLVYHLNAAWLPGGFAGVDVFFVISGFIVSASVASLDRVSLPKFMGYFYARRLQRIAPALIVCLLITALASALLIPSAWLGRANQQTGLYAFVGLSNFILASTDNDYFSPLVDFNPYTHTWSLGVEEQFYFVFPLLFFAWTFFGRWRWLTVGLFGAALLASTSWALWLGQTNKTLAFYMITSRFWQLAAGVLLFQAMALAGRRFDTARQPSPRWFTLGALASLALIGYAFVVSRPDAFPMPGALPAVVGTLGVIAFLHGKGDDNLLVRALTGPVILYIGRISYSLYLWHWPVIVLFRWTIGIDSPAQRLVAVVLAFSLAIASYHWVETPMRHLRVLQGAPRYVIVMSGLLLVGCATWFGYQINQAQGRISLSTVTHHAGDWYPWGREPTPVSAGCLVLTEMTPVGSGHVTTYSRQGCDLAVNGPRVLAIGDSHAIGYGAMYKGYAMQTGAPVSVYNNGGCSFLSLQPWREVSEQCKTDSRIALDHINERTRPGDIVFLPSLRMPRFADQWVRFPDSQVEDQLFGDWAVQARTAAVAAAEDVLRRLRATGALVVWEAPGPVFRAPAYRCAETYNRTNPICRDGTEIDRVEMERLRKPVVDALNNLAQSMPGVSVWDPFPVLCPVAESCSAFSGDLPLFFDADHVSGYGNRLLLPSFQAFVSRAGGA